MNSQSEQPSTETDKQIPDPSFPLFVDSGIMRDFSRCLRRGYWHNVRRLVSPGRDIHLEFGGAYAKGLEMFRRAYYGKKMSIDKAKAFGALHMTKYYGIEPIETPESPKDYMRLLAAYSFYFQEWPPDTDFVQPFMIGDEPAVEWSFAVPLEIHHPDNPKEPILYVGKFDMLAIKDGVLFVYDDKTTGAMGKTWAESWEYDHQMTGYIWGAKDYGYPVAGAIIRGACILTKQIKFLPAITYRQDWEVDRWYHEVHETIHRAIRAYKSGDWPTEGMFASRCVREGCAYRALCASKDPEPWIPGNFVANEWSPIEIPASEVVTIE
jgi:hypothetical protein